VDYNRPGAHRDVGDHDGARSAHHAYPEDRLCLPHPEPRARTADPHDGVLQDNDRVGGVGAAAAAHCHVHLRHHQ